MLVIAAAVTVALLTLPTPAYANQSSQAHQFCMENMREGSAIALHKRFKPLTRNEEEWDRLVSVVLETWHEACFSLLGVPDNRIEEDAMPWVSPGMICEPL
jgi:hypothetical protein